MDQDLAILSPEKTILTYRLAGLGSRIGAHLLDLLLITVIGIAISIAVSYVAAHIDQSAMGFLIVLVFLGPFLYFILFEGLWNGITPGKKALGIRVRMADGTPITFTAAIGRNFLRAADLLPGPYFVGMLAIFTNPKSQRLGDLIANTVVTYERRPMPFFATAPHVVGFHPLEQYVGELRGMTLEEYNALRRFADRFPELPTSVQNKLLHEVWEPIAAQRKVPSLPNVHPAYLIEAVVMKYGRTKGLL